MGGFKDTGLDPVFAELLARQREPINGFFHQAKHFSHHLEPETVYEFLTDTIQPLVLAAAPLLDAEALDRLALKLIVLAMDLIGKQLLTHDGNFALIESGWRRLFCRYPELLVSSPRRAIAAVSNALVHLCLHPGANPARWLDELERLGEHCPDLPSFLQLGQILGWRCGLAHFRQGALTLLPQLPLHLQTILLENQPLEAWRGSPWTGLSESRSRTGRMGRIKRRGEEAELEIVHVSGEFAGWGGRLLQPPTIAWEGDTLLVDDGVNSWYLFLDAFGESWFRRPHSPISEHTDTGPWTLSPDGQVNHAEISTTFPELAHWRQAVGNEHTLAVVMPQSFRIYCCSVV